MKKNAASNASAAIRNGCRARIPFCMSVSSLGDSRPPKREHSEQGRRLLQSKTSTLSRWPPSLNRGSKSPLFGGGSLCVAFDRAEAGTSYRGDQQRDLSASGPRVFGVGRHVRLTGVIALLSPARRFSPRTSGESQHRPLCP